MGDIGALGVDPSNACGYATLLSGEVGRFGGRGLCEQAGLPVLTLYDLRRTAGSLLVDAGVHLECVADLLGHASVATTRRHYVRAVRPTVPHAVGLDAVLG